MYFHIWFVTKYRKPVLAGGMEQTVKDIFAECIQRHNYQVLEYETNQDHVHLLVEAANRQELSAIVRTLKSVSSKEIRSTPCFRMENVGYHRRKPVEAQRSFWATRYGYRQIHKTELESIRNYIQNQKRIPHTPA